MADTPTLRNTRAAGKRTVVMFWIATALTALLACAWFWRQLVWHDVVDGGSYGADLVDADRVVKWLTVFHLLAVLACMGSVASWSHAVARNASERGNPRVQAEGAAWGWLIPIGWFWLGFQQLRHAAFKTSVDLRPLSRWQTMFVAQGVLNLVARNVFGDNLDGEPSFRGAHLPWLLALTTAALCVVATMAAADSIGSFTASEVGGS